jgi:hypothetical protein
VCFVFVFLLSFTGMCENRASVVKKNVLCGVSEMLRRCVMPKNTCHKSVFPLQ